jgi:hypothetical protein
MLPWQRGRGPRGDLSPSRGRERENYIPVVVHGDGGGEFFHPRGWGWGSIPRLGIPRCHPYPLRAFALGS